MMKLYFCAIESFQHTASQTSLNEQESAAMPGMSSLLTMLAYTPGTCVKAFHTVHWICDGKRGGDSEFTEGYV